MRKITEQTKTQINKTFSNTFPSDLFYNLLLPEQCVVCVCSISVKCELSTIEIYQLNSNN